MSTVLTRKNFQKWLIKRKAIGQSADAVPYFSKKDIGGQEVKQRHWAMWKKLIQATAITSALYLVMGMGKPSTERQAIQSQILEMSQQPFKAFNKHPHVKP